MKTMLILLSILGLITTIVPPILLFFEKIELGDMKIWMGVGMVMWFVTAPFWINKSVNSKES